MLLLRPRQAVPIDTIVAWVWPDGEGPESPASTFYKYARRIRDALDLMDPQPDLRGENGAYRIDADRSEIDYFQFRAAVEHGRSIGRAGDHDRAYHIIDRAVDLWTGLPLADLRGERAANWRLRAQADLWIPAQDFLLQELSALGRHDQVLRRLDDLPVEHQFNLILVKRRLEALYALIRHKDAITYLHQVRKQLRANDELDEADELLRFHNELRERAGNRQAGVVLGAGTTTATGMTAPVPHMLRRDIADFVGRGDLLDELTDKTTTPSGELAATVVIMDGPPGVGKTTLAVHWAHQMRDRFCGGDLFIDMHGYSDRAKLESSAVIADFLIALGHPPDNTMSQRVKELLLSRLLNDRRTLVVLDNVRDDAQVRELIPLLSGSLVLVTSRQRLRTLSTLTGACRVPVEPMTPAEATQLLSTRLGTRRPVNPDDRARLVQLCDGLPLVISVLAEHLATGPAKVSEFARGLDRRRLIDIGEPGEDTVSAGTVFTQSYRALAEQERRLFRLLALHPSPNVSLDAACACDGRTVPETIRSLSALVGAHLLEQPDTFDQYRCHDLLAEFAAHCVESDETAEARHATERRLLGYYLASALQACRTLYPSYLPPPSLETKPDVHPTTFTDGAHARMWFDRERTNLIAAITYAADNGYHDFAWRLVDPVATFFDRDGYYAASLDARTLAVTSARAIGDSEGETSALIGLGIVHMKLGNHAPARRCLDAALRLAEDNGIERGRAAVLNHLGRLHILRDDPATALTLYQRALDIAQRTDDRDGVCWTHCRIGEALRLTDQHEQALAYLHQARWLAQQIGDDSALATSLTEIGAALHELGDHPAAAAHCKQAIEIAETIPDLAVTAQACIALAVISSRQDTGTAIRYTQRAIDVCQRTHNLADHARALEVLGNVQHADGDPHSAALAWRQAADLFRHIGNPSRAALTQTKIDSVSPPHSPVVPATRTDSRHSVDVDSDHIPTAGDHPLS